MGVFGRRSARNPIDQRTQRWVDTELSWLATEFGQSMLFRPVLTPTVEVFGPNIRAGDPTQVPVIVEALATHMGILAKLEIEIFDDGDREARAALGGAGPWRARAGDWSQRDGRSVIAVDRAIVQSPRVLVATIAHELAHERLLGESRIDPARPDGEQLTDLATVFFGLGIYTANAAREFGGAIEGGWHSSRLGYLDEATFGYGLARYCWLRGEADPAWACHLDKNPAAFMKQSRRYLATQAGSSDQ